MHEDVDRIYIDWSPDTELSEDDIYTVQVLIVCRRPNTRDHLLDELSGLASGVKKAPLMNAVRMDDPDVVLSRDVTIEQTARMTRFTSFDEFSALSEVARVMRGE